ncbi:MAG: single-stranded DNA-binding protein [Bacteroides sp.]|nr:single-stranded DNA-binding protein [Roseburia sp.]MCM1345528.1 single-stranded DNA-binding protein [Bacteroides sp.]MCM1420359.1 single-stranded DNA-binding protein [Bacteroides sp.]
MSLNKVMLIGNVGQEPVVRYLDQGVCVATASLATTERGYTLPNGTQVPERTEWHNLVFWRKQAEIVEKYVHKGDKLYVEGKIQSRTWNDKQGVRHQIVEIMVENMEMLSARPSQNVQPTNEPQTIKPTPTSQNSQVVRPQDNNGQFPF